MVSIQSRSLRLVSWRILAHTSLVGKAPAAQVGMIGGEQEEDAWKASKSGYEIMPGRNKVGIELVLDGKHQMFLELSISYFSSSNNSE